MSVALRLTLGIAALTLSPNATAQPGHDWTITNLHNLQKAASKGVKPAQFELGRRYEEGTGVERDISKARKWYKKAARDSVGRNFVYSGPVGNEQLGRAIEVGQPKVQPGMPAAALRLKNLERDHED